MASGTELESTRAATEVPWLEKAGPHAPKILLGAAAMGLISLFLPAVTVSFLGTSQSVNGFSAWQGKLGLVAYLGVGVLAGLILKKDFAPVRNQLLACLITAGVALVLAVWLMLAVGRAPVSAGLPDVGLSVSTGFGAYLNILASLVLVGGATIQAKRAKLF